MPWSLGMVFGILAKLGHIAVSKTAMHCPPVVVCTLRSISMVKRTSFSWAHSPQPHDGKDAARQYDKVGEVVAEWHTCEHGEWSVKLFEVSVNHPPEKKSTYSGTYSAICRNYQAHESVTEDACAYGHSPAETNRNHSRRYATSESGT